MKVFQKKNYILFNYQNRILYQKQFMYLNFIHLYFEEGTNFLKKNLNMLPLHTLSLFRLTFMKKIESSQIFHSFKLIEGEFIFRNFSILQQKLMGETCSACNNRELKFEQIEIDENPKIIDKKASNLSAHAPTANPINMKDTQQSKKQEKKKEVSVLTSKFNQSKSYQKYGNGGKILDEMPNYSNQIIKKKLEELGNFIYNRPEFQCNDSQRLKPIQFENKYVYDGEWKDNQRHGRGIQQWKDGSLYEGYWKNNVAHGFGRLVHADGDVYYGQWAFDRAFGKGIYYSSSGARYQGQWIQDKQHGYGQQFWPDGSVYRGQYHQGKKQGHGKFIWEDQSSYEGQFKDNQINGNGIYAWKDGRIYQGEWKNNKMSGKGVFIWPDGRKYEGQYVNDKKQGFGIFLFKDGRCYEGQWKNGKQHGKGIFRKKNASKQGIWAEGQRIKWLDEGKQNDN